MTDKLRAAAEMALEALEIWEKMQPNTTACAVRIPAIKELRQALAEPDTMTGWQPIETAPKDGRKLILILTPSMWPQLAYSNTWWRAGFSVETKPTHWMDIPDIETEHGTLGRGKWAI
jgi:hypothetical protein